MSDKTKYRILAGTFAVVALALLVYIEDIARWCADTYIKIYHSYGERNMTASYLPVDGTNVSMARFPVTVGDYEKYRAATGLAMFDTDALVYPVVGVTRKEATSYARWLSAQHGVMYRLPTAREWELAAGPMPSESKEMNCGTGAGIVPVYAYAKTRAISGAVQMWGNVWEWTEDEGENADCVEVKGGSWQSTRRECHTMNRSECRNPLQGYPDVGFRLVRVD